MDVAHGGIVSPWGFEWFGRVPLMKGRQRSTAAPCIQASHCYLLEDPVDAEVLCHNLWLERA